MLTIVLVVLLVLALLSIPTWGYSRGWGYFPSGTLALILVVLLMLWLVGVVS